VCAKRQCSTCQHIKRAEIDRRLAAGEPGKQIARDYELNPSSLHRHRVNCLGLPSSNATMKEASRGTAAVACLPSKDDLNSAYFDLLARIEQIVSQAQKEGSLSVALNGLNSIRRMLGYADYYFTRTTRRRRCCRPSSSRAGRRRITSRRHTANGPALLERTTSLRRRHHARGLSEPEFRQFQSL
jgi:hypothetical protein